MLGAIIGDIVGSKYEFNNIKTMDFPLFSEGCRFTDDTVMTAAVCMGVLNGLNDVRKTAKTVESYMVLYGGYYPEAGYGKRFDEWLHDRFRKPYGSYGNGSAMRVSSVAWLFESLEAVEKFAEATASVTHDHPEGIKGACAVAGATYLARAGRDKQTIKDYVERKYRYDISKTIDEIRPEYTYDVSCQGSAPVAIIAALESESFEEAIRKAVSVGGDSDTIAAMAGAIAEGLYGIPEEIKNEALTYLDGRLKEVLAKFEDKLAKIREDEERFKKACEFAAEKHKGQKRAGGADYISHPMEVAMRLKNALYPIEYAITGVFHDLLEDTDATEEEIEAIGGKEVLETVKLLTKEPGYDMKSYITRISANDMARIVKGADRVHNLECSILRDFDFRDRYMWETKQWYLGIDDGTRLDTTVQDAFNELEEYNEISDWDI